ncbi:MAG: hypothetical protein COB29_15920 [Sulfitobacter sp.]|nr:MAG: hypothetical protein COB29_15920 [Sulfitobacter sp.]
MKLSKKLCLVAWLISLIALDACTPTHLSIPEVKVQKSYVTLAQAIEQRNFKYNENRSLYLDADGKSIQTYFTDIDASRVSSIRIVPNSRRSVAEAIAVSTLFQNLRFGQISVYRANPTFEVQTEELRVEILRYGLWASSCKADKRIIPFGCSVEINRALSLYNLGELQFGRTLALPSGQNEMRAIRNYMNGESASLSGLKKGTGH